ncbi:MAG: NADH-quinone oxidoreductase subunit L [Bacteroidia bacterium]|nr:NADH-quinone oxidoreductase subunit L [Bacteroidia bacterium]MBP9689545.1 NADH-quinone oxidoreductase subunit L [Bacteroidia bacterium]
MIHDTLLVTPALLIPLLPLIGFLINGLFGKFLPKSVTGWIATLFILGSFICSITLFNGLDASSKINIDVFNWIAFSKINISFGFLIDSLTITMLLVVTGIGFLIHLYSIGYMHDDEGFTRFFTYLNLFIFFMLLLVMGNNYLVMFIGWEGVGLCSYLLIGFWFKNNDFNNAAKKAFIMNRIGDLGFLIAMFFMLFYFGSLEYNTVATQAQLLTPNSALLIAITMLLFVGAMGKSAQLPLYTWLPDAMAGPTPVSALIHAATMVTAGIYMIVRSNILFSLSPTTLTFILIIGVITSVFAAVIGLLQNDIKKVLAYSTVSQLGLMFAALGLGAFSSGMFHVVTHAFFKALLFLAAGSVIHALHGEQDIRKMGGLGKYIKVTFITFFLASLAISGFPFLSGFFSKDEILAHAFEQNKTIWAILSISSFITAFYMFRLVFLTFFGNFRGTEETKKHIHESPATMTIPLIILCILAVVGGFLGLPEVFHVQHAFSNYLSAVTSGSEQYLVHHDKVSHSTEIILMSFAGIGAIVVIMFAYFKYVKKAELPVNDNELTGLNKVISNKFYVDEIYDTLIVKPITILSDLFLVLVDKLIIDLAVNATAWIVATTGKTMRLFQTGNTGFYVFAMVIGMMVLLIIRLFI